MSLRKIIAHLKYHKMGITKTIARFAGYTSVFLFCSNVLAHPINMDAVAFIESEGRPLATSFRGPEFGRGTFMISEICLKHYWQDNPEPVIYWNIGKDNTVIRSTDHPDVLYDYRFNRRVAEFYMSWLSERCDSIEEILIAYNWGIGNLRKWRRNGSRPEDLPNETLNYIQKYHEFVEGVK